MNQVEVSPAGTLSSLIPPLINWVRHPQFHEALKRDLNQLITSALIRPADACNLLLVTAGVKPSTLIVLNTPNEAGRLLATIREATSCDLSVRIHFDPEVGQFYFMASRLQKSIDMLDCLGSKNCLPKAPGMHYQTAISSPEYHLELGRFLDVPECCRVDRAVMPKEADLLFREILLRIDQGELTFDAHYSPHLPCTPDCKETLRIATKYREWVEKNCPDYGVLFEDKRREKPLYLY